jgi:hypothetical protein
MARTKIAVAMQWTTGHVEMDQKIISQEMLASRCRRFTPRGKGPKNSCKQGSENNN